LFLSRPAFAHIYFRGRRTMGNCPAPPDTN
jgi:hypothetical protein